MKSKHFLDIKETAAEELIDLIDLAHKMKANPLGYSDALKGKTLGLLFEKPSLRTRISFEVGFKQLGGAVSVLSNEEVGLGKRESIEDVSRVLSRYLDILVLRLFSHNDLIDFSEVCQVPVVNGLTDLSHPCQSLADLLTIQEFAPGAKKVAFVGDGNNVCRSLTELCKVFNIEVLQICPRGFELKNTGSNFSVSHQIEEASSCDVIYTDVVVSMGQEENSREKLACFKNFQVTSELMQKASRDAIFLHCLPAHRGLEVTHEVLESRYSKVFDQAENRMHAQKALLFRLLSN